ncbi:MAG: hypothetical protein P8129_21940, partial [Anaerolineae bacterium]
RAAFKQERDMIREEQVESVMARSPAFGGWRSGAISNYTIGDCFVARKRRSLLAMTVSYILSGDLRHGKLAMTVLSAAKVARRPALPPSPFQCIIGSANAQELADLL